MSIRKLISIADKFFNGIEWLGGLFGSLKRRWNEGAVERAVNKKDDTAVGVRKLIVRIIKRRNKRRDSS